MSYFPETETINILDIFEKCGEEALLTCLSSFSCPKNMEVENFLKEKALDFARKKLSITYLLMDNNDATLLGYFTLAHKTIEIFNYSTLSNTTKRKLSLYANCEIDSSCYTISAFLLAQIGKNNSVENGRRINGNILMETVIDILLDIQHRIGGGIIFLDCEDNEKLRKYYEQNRYKIFGERNEQVTGIKYLQMMRFF